MDEDGLPKYTRFDDKQQKSTRVPIRPRKRSAIYGIITITALLTLVHQLSQTSPTININVPPQSYSLDATRLEANLATCAKLHSTPQDPSGPRTKNARYVDGHPPVLIRNATYWTGEPVPGTLDAYAWVTGDVLMEEGMIVRVGGNPGGDLPDGTEVYEAQGRMVSAGIVDMRRSLAFSFGSTLCFLSIFAPDTPNTRAAMWPKF